MLEFALLPGNFPFSVALALMGAIGVLEVVTLALGMSASGVVDSVLPDFDFDVDVDFDLDVDADADLATHTPALSGLFSWLHVGKVPTLILFVAFLMGFGLSGFAVQGLAKLVFGSALASGLAAVPAFLGALPVIHIAGRVFRVVLPSEQTDAMSRQTLIGRTAVLTLGTARNGEPAQARLKDAGGQMQYVMVEPKDDSVFEAGDEVVLVAMDGAHFKGVKSDMPRLSDRVS
ncbi:MAG: YqiJ family protein [Myxococcota bacterium]